MFKTVFNDIYAEKVYHEISDKIKKFCVIMCRHIYCGLCFES